MDLESDVIVPVHLLFARLASNFGFSGQPLTWEELSL